MLILPIFYTGINDLFQPLLLFGILLALRHFADSQISNQRQTGLRLFHSALSESAHFVLLYLIVGLGLYILFKLAVTAGGWVLICHNIADTILGQQIPCIEYQMGIGACVFLVALIIILIMAIVKFIKHRRGKKA